MHFDFFRAAFVKIIDKFVFVTKILIIPAVFIFYVFFLMNFTIFTNFSSFNKQNIYGRLNLKPLEFNCSRNFQQLINSTKNCLMNRFFSSKNIFGQLPDIVKECSTPLFDRSKVDHLLNFDEMKAFIDFVELMPRPIRKECISLTLGIGKSKRKSK